PGYGTPPPRTAGDNFSAPAGSPPAKPIGTLLTEAVQFYTKHWVALCATCAALFLPIAVGEAALHAIILEPTVAATDVMSRKAQELSRQAEDMQRGLQQAQNMDPKKRQEYAREQARLAAERTRAIAETGTVAGGA